MWQAPSDLKTPRQRQNRYRELHEARPTPTRQSRRSTHRLAPSRGPGLIQDARVWWLMLLGTRAMESGGSIGQVECDKKPLFGGESPGFIDLVFRESVSQSARAARTAHVGRGGVRLHGAIVQRTCKTVTSGLNQSRSAARFSSLRARGRCLRQPLFWFSPMTVKSPNSEEARLFVVDGSAA